MENTLAQIINALIQTNARVAELTRELEAAQKRIAELEKAPE